MSVQSIINVGQFGLSGLTIEDYLVRGDWNPITSLYPDNFGVNSIWFVVLPVDTVYLVFDGREWRDGDILSYTVGNSSYDHFQKPTPRTFQLTGVVEGTAEYDGSNIVTIDTSGHLKAPNGTTAERPINPENGDIFFNNTTNSYEGYSNGQWGGLGGANANGAILETSQNITESYTLTLGKNGISAGPINLADGVSVIIPDGARWVIV